MTEQVRLCALWPMENWLGSSLNQIQGWTAVCQSYSRALEQGPLLQMELDRDGSAIRTGLGPPAPPRAAGPVGRRRHLDVLPGPLHHRLRGRLVRPLGAGLHRRDVGGVAAGRPWVLHAARALLRGSLLLRRRGGRRLGRPYRNLRHISL